MEDDPISPAFLVGISLCTTIASAVIHEGGHVLFGRLVGLRIRLIEIGEGPLVFRLPLGLVILRLRLFPVTGRVAAYAGFTWSRTQIVLYVAGGALANLVCAICAFALLPDWDRGPHAHLAVVSLGLLNLLFVLLVLPPYRLKRSLPSDGWQIRDTLRKTPGENSDLIGAYRRIVQDRYGSEDATPSRLGHVVIHALLHLAPDRPDSRAKDGIASLGRVDRDRLATTLLGRHDLAAAERAALLDLLVSSWLLRGPYERLGVLDRQSEELMSLAPRSAAARGTRGGVLILLGRPEGRALVEQDAPSDEPFDQLMRRTFLARALLNEGDRARAMTLAADARADLLAYGTDRFPVLERIEAELAQRP